jgi:hypothetical protein
VSDGLFKDYNNIPYPHLSYAVLNERLNLLRLADIPLFVQDARDYHALSHLVTKIDPQVIIHLAAVSHANRSNKDPYSTFDHSLQTLENALDYSKNKKIGLGELFKTYLKEDGLKLISKLNNKIIIQNDDKFNLLTFKNDDDSLRFIDNVSEHFINEKRYDCMFVKDYSTSQRKYLYNLLEENGFPKHYLIRHSTTHPTKT